MHALRAFYCYKLYKKGSCEAGFSACGGSRKRHSSIPLQYDPRGAFIIVWKRSFLYDNKDARISPDTSQFVFLPYLRLPVNARNQLLCIIGHSSFICLKFCLSYSVCLSCMRPCHLHTYFQVLPLIFHTAMPHSHWH